MMQNHIPLQEDFSGVRDLYDKSMADNVRIHDLVYTKVFGPDQYIGQFSDNGADELRLMGDILNLPCSADVLDIGCGRGNVAAFMAETFHWHVAGIDLSTVSVAAAKQSSSNVMIIEGDVYDHTFAHQFDAIYCTGAACHFDAERLLTRCRELLRPGGRVAIFERVRRGTIPSDMWTHLTESWKCPYVYSVEEYHEAFKNAGMTVCHSIDTTERFRRWQDRSVTVRDKLRDQIISLSSKAYFNTSRDLAAYENTVTQQGLLGYALLVGEV